MNSTSASESHLLQFISSSFIFHLLSFIFSSSIFPSFLFFFSILFLFFPFLCLSFLFMSFLYGMHYAHILRTSALISSDAELTLTSFLTHPRSENEQRLVRIKHSRHRKEQSRSAKEQQALTLNFHCLSLRSPRSQCKSSHLPTGEEADGS